MARDIKDFQNREFIEGARTSLASDGFVTDEHKFAPYRDIMVSHVHEIERLLDDGATTMQLGVSMLSTDLAGNVYFIYDTAKYNEKDAKKAVLKWINEKYK